MVIMSNEKHVVVSGGSKGLGRGIVEALLKSGYNVSTFSRKPTQFIETVSSSIDKERFFFLEADLGDSKSLHRFFKASCENFGAPWGLVNNAAVAHDDLLIVTPDERFDHLLHVNVTGTFLLTKLCGRAMLVEHRGRIVNISSIVGQRGFRGLALYGATKAALDASTRALARELGPVGITVNSISPGFIETDMSAGLDERQKERIINRTPLGRLGTAEDVANLVRFLLSPEVSFITGQTIAVDGGNIC